MSKLITLRTFLDPSEQALAKAFLASEGIESYSKDSIMNRVYPAQVFNGIELQVAEEDVEQAVVVLIQGGYLKKEDFEPSDEIKWITKIFNKFRK